MRDFILGNRRFFILWTGWVFLWVTIWAFRMYGFKEFLVCGIAPGLFYILFKLWRSENNNNSEFVTKGRRFIMRNKLFFIIWGVWVSLNLLLLIFIMHNGFENEFWFFSNPPS